MIELRGVTKRYASGKVAVVALREVNFAVRPGDFSVIKGPSGSGKSTLLNILGLLDSPSEGEVFLHDRPVSFADFDRLAEERARVMSFIFQSFNLNPVLTLEENIMVPLMIRSDLTRAERRRRVADWIGKIGLGEHRRHRPDELSGGQRQRVAIARAMVTEPALVIADEPTANLDSRTSGSILALMRELNESRRVAFVFATHDPLLQGYARQTWQMHDGALSVEPAAPGEGGVAPP